MTSVAFVALLLPCLLFSGCHSDVKKDILPQKPTGAFFGEFIQLTTEGENIRGRFSPDGSKIIYQSRNRGPHKKFQIYILDLNTKKEHRITYNDGDDFSPVFDNKGKRILYASTTDEIKEHSDDSIRPSNTYDPKTIVEEQAGYEEIYSSDADGSHIQRLTHAVGFDGDPIYSPDGHRIFFVSQRLGQQPTIFSMDARGGRQAPLMKTSEYQIHPRLSPNGRQMIWESLSSPGHVQIKISDLAGKHLSQLTHFDGINRDPKWFENGKRIIYSANRDGINFNIFVMNADGTCLKSLTRPPSVDPKKRVQEQPVADLFPMVSPDGKKVLLSSNRSGMFQLYLMDFQEPKDCYPESP